MSNVVHLNVPSRSDREAQRHAALLRSFAQHRRLGDDVFWLKENAELLNILECTGTRPAAAALAVHEKVYVRVEQRLGFFPQYYRFLLSICLDLEDLGFGGKKGEVLVDWVAGEGLVEAELSDLQRGEARRLMLRRGVDPLAHDDGLDDRLRGFIARPATFALPNKKAAYELTHTVFYLSEYGRRDPRIDADTRQSLDFAGTLAFLDQNADLLAEICIAMRYAGLTPPQIWEDWLAAHLRGFAVERGEHLPVGDDYHEYFVCNWLMAAAGGTAFTGRFEEGRMAFFRPETGFGPLREISECMFHLENRTGDWARMRGVVAERLSEAGHRILSLAEAASQDFERFFSGFARTGLGAGLPPSRQEARA
ncbi:DUF6902 family protein [Marimonas arenosa]|uniref:Uncharacterized protein n=1 Tax=Marimonas arenosa TaxID=1795305 RepID=A0AAE4B3L0_9RHOB|nr:hypothetical protein [Marimonas arenosa]MDQ2088489.1 hypothetical protein [Marimonas arenosa]